MSKLEEAADQDGSKLTAEDMKRVHHVTTTGLNAVERKPFRAKLLLGSIVVGILLLGQLSIWIADMALASIQ